MPPFVVVARRHGHRFFKDPASGLGCFDKQGMLDCGALVARSLLVEGVVAISGLPSGAGNGHLIGDRSKRGKTIHLFKETLGPHQMTEQELQRIWQLG
jgi:hypothetical protein